MAYFSCNLVYILIELFHIFFCLIVISSCIVNVATKIGLKCHILTTHIFQSKVKKVVLSSNIFQMFKLSSIFLELN